MLISMNDVQLAQARCEEFRRDADGRVFASHMIVSGGKRTVADRLTGMRTQSGNWIECQLTAWGRRLQAGFTHHQA